MLGINLIERLGVTGQAIRDQQRAANLLAGALAELATETETMEAQIRASGLPTPFLKEGLHHGPLHMDVVMPGIPSMPSSIVPTGVLSQLPADTFFLDEAPGCALNCMQRRRNSVKSTDAHRTDVVALPSFSTTPSALPSLRSPERTGSLDAPIQRPSVIMLEGHRIKDYADAAEARKSKHRSPRIFSDPDELRNQIRENLTEDAYDATTFYKETGIFQAVARSSWFEMSSMILVLFSCVWMAVETDLNESMSLHESDPIFQVVAHLTCLLFLLEILVRILAFRRLWYAMKDRWIMFDVVLVMLFVLETWILGTVADVAGTTLGGSGMKLVILFRVLRLLRILRLARVLRILPELMVIIRGLGRALRAIIVVLALIGMIIFVAAMVFTAVLEDSELGKEYFPTVLTSMGTLMLDCTLSGSRGTGLMRAAFDVHPIFGLMMLLYVLLANVTMLGVLTGLLVQTVKTVAEVEKEEKQVQQLVDQMEQLWKMLQECDHDNDGTADVHEFKELISNKDTARLLRTLDVDVEGLASISDFVFAQHQGRLGRKEFMQMVLDVRNNKSATVKDHIETRRFVEAKLLPVFTTLSNGGGL